MIKILDGIKSAANIMVAGGLNFEPVPYRRTMIKALFAGGVKGIKSSNKKVYSFFLFCGLILTLLPAMFLIDLSNFFKKMVFKRG